jgi:hypothetical protein
LEILAPSAKSLIQFSAAPKVAGSEEKPTRDGLGDSRHYFPEVENVAVFPGSRDLFNTLHNRRGKFHRRGAAKDRLEGRAQTTMPIS